jgi:hypothetical protein
MRDAGIVAMPQRMGLRRGRVLMSEEGGFTEGQMVVLRCSGRLAKVVDKRGRGKDPQFWSSYPSQV